MKELESVLDDCLRRMRAEGYSVGQCLAQYPEHASQLRPLLEAAGRLNGARAIEPSQFYRVSARAKLMKEAAGQAHRMSQGLRPAWRLAFAVAALAAVLLLSTTAFAQAALPGGPLYNWKLGSEEMWRAVSADPVTVDLTLVERRTTEWTKVVSNPEREGQARDEFHEVLTRLEAEKDTKNGPKIEQALQAHQKKLSEAGIKDKDLDEVVKGKGHKDK